eukprot:6242169-Alexandrium_andersonii.AAC.1
MPLAFGTWGSTRGFNPRVRGSALGSHRGVAASPTPRRSLLQRLPPCGEERRGPPTRRSNPTSTSTLVDCVSLGRVALNVAVLRGPPLRVDPPPTRWLPPTNGSRPPRLRRRCLYRAPVG